MQTSRVFSLVLAVLAAVAIGCDDGEPAGTATTGSSADSGASGSTAAPAAPSDPQAAALAFARCMREEGVADYPDPTFEDGMILVGGDGIDPEDRAVVAATEVCEDLLDPASGGFDAPSGDELLAVQESVLEFAACMREQGVDFPDPTFDDSGMIELTPPGDPNDPAIAAARAVCEPLMLRPGGGS